MIERVWKHYFVGSLSQMMISAGYQSLDEAIKISYEHADTQFLECGSDADPHRAARATFEALAEFVQ